MRIAALLGICAAVGLAVLGFTLLGSGSGADAAQPKLQLLDTHPLTVRGTHFRDGEEVRLSAGASSARTTADGDGTLVVTIAGGTRCDMTRVLARGSKGSFTVLKLLPLPACAPVRTG